MPTALLAILDLLHERSCELVIGGMSLCAGNWKVSIGVSGIEDPKCNEAQLSARQILARTRAVPLTVTV